MVESQPNQGFDIEKLRNPEMACIFQLILDGKFALLISLRDDDIDIDN